EFEDGKEEVADALDEIEDNIASAKSQKKNLEKSAKIMDKLSMLVMMRDALEPYTEDAVLNLTLGAIAENTENPLRETVAQLLTPGSGFTEATTLGEVKATINPSIATILTVYDTLRTASGLTASGFTASNITLADVPTVKSNYELLWLNSYTGIQTMIASLESAQTQLESTQDSFDKTQEQLDKAKEQLDSAEETLDDNQKTIDDNVEQYQESLKKFNKQRAEALKHANADQLLDIKTLAQLIAAQNFEMPAGYIDDRDGNSWLLKVGENFDSTEVLKDVVLCNITDIGDVKISDVADVTMIDNAEESYSKINGEQSILLAIYKSSTASTKEVGDAVVAAAQELQDSTPGLHSMAFFNQGDYISLITSSILESMIIGAALAIIILAIFLKDVMPTLVVAISIPLSVLVAIVCLYFSNITLNIMSLAGLALGVGMLVDNSIVVIENIYRLKTLGMNSHQAAVTGARQVAAPIISSTLTTICVFLPMIFTTGIVKELLIPMAFSVVFCLVASLLVALSVVPAAGSTLLRNSREKEHKAFDRLMEKYGRSLNWCLEHKVIPLTLSIALLAGSVFAIIKMGVVMIPDMYSEPLVLTVTVDETKTREESYEIADQVIVAVSDIEGVEAASAMTSGSMLSMFSASGSSSGAYDSYACYVLLEGENQSEKEIKAIVDQIEEKTANIDCEISISANEMDMSMLTGSGLAIRVYGQNMDKVEDITEDIMEIVKTVDGYEEISNGMEDGDDVIHLLIDKNKAMSKGLSVAQIYMDLAGKISNTVDATTLTVDGIEIDVEIEDGTYPLTKDNLLSYTFDVQTTDSDGDTVTKTYKLSDLATIETEKTLSTLERSGNSRYMTVSATVAEGENATLLSRELAPLIESYDAPAGYRVEMSGEAEATQDMVIQMSKLIALGFLFIYLVMVAQFQSLLSPFIVLFTVPLAFTGGMIGLLLKGENLSVMSLMGFTILMGTVVNNGIVFVDYVNQLRIEGQERRDALIETGKTRMRPILMTALTTILAMSNLLFGNDIGSQMGGGMAVVIMGGLTYATFMTLYIIPIIYDIFFKKPPLHVEVE
ncbi:MAG: efflux RND transporter permease subunit, partial [Bacillota bacterium]|nr:efflux RND transporter permease subunit [Bacillota bacterium]